MSAELLKRCALFRDFTPVGLELFAKISKPRIVLRGKPLFAEGTPSETLYLLVEGRVQVLVKTAEGTISTVASLGAGESLCEMALLSPAKPVAHMCSVVAEVDSKVLEGSSADLQALMKDKPQACVKLLLACAAEVGRKAGDARDLLKHMVARSVGR